MYSKQWTRIILITSPFAIALSLMLSILYGAKHLSTDIVLHLSFISIRETQTIKLYGTPGFQGRRRSAHRAHLLFLERLCKALRAII